MASNLVPVSHRNFIGDPFSFLREEIDRLFDKNNSVQGIRPEFEVTENKDLLTVTAELPGLSQENIDITLVDGVLTISGEKKSEEVKEDQIYHITERRYGSFSRSLKLPYNPEQSEVTASFKDGILTLKIPRPVTAKPNVHKITIRNE